MKMRPVNSNCCSHAYQSPVCVRECVHACVSVCVCVCSLQETGEVSCEQSLISLSSKIIFIATSTFTSHQLSWFYIHNNIIGYCTTPASASAHWHSQFWHMDEQNNNDLYKHPQILHWFLVWFTPGVLVTFPNRSHSHLELGETMMHQTGDITGNPKL